MFDGCVVLFFVRYIRLCVVYFLLVVQFRYFENEFDGVVVSVSLLVLLWCGWLQYDVVYDFGVCVALFYFGENGLFVKWAFSGADWLCGYEFVLFNVFSCQAERFMCVVFLFGVLIIWLECCGF